MKCFSPDVNGGSSTATDGSAGSSPASQEGAQSFDQGSAVSDQGQSSQAQGQQFQQRQAQGQGQQGQNQSIPYDRFRQVNQEAAAWRSGQHPKFVETALQNPGVQEAAANWALQQLDQTLQEVDPELRQQVLTTLKMHKAGRLSPQQQRQDPTQQQQPNYLTREELEAEKAKWQQEATQTWEQKQAVSALQSEITAEMTAYGITDPDMQDDFVTLMAKTIQKEAQQGRVRSTADVARDVVAKMQKVVGIAQKARPPSPSFTPNGSRGANLSGAELEAQKLENIFRNTGIRLRD